MGEVAEALLPVLGIMAVFSVPIVAILTAHQRKMAELMHSRAAVAPAATDPAVLRELLELRQLAQQQAIQIDTLVEGQRTLLAQLRSSDVAARMKVGE